MGAVASDQEMLVQARDRAGHLVADVLRQQQELARRMPQATAGLGAMQDVIDALRRTAAALDAARTGPSDDRLDSTH